MEDPNKEIFDYKGMFWDDINKRFYRWHELEPINEGTGD
jgi:hypothetical protein